MNVKMISLTKGVGEFDNKSAEDIIVYAARVSSNRDDKFESPEKLLSYCIRNKHWSIFETAYITFEIETSRAIGRQLLRHQAKFQEFSQRYSEVMEFESVELRKQGKTNRQSSEEEIDPEIFNIVVGDMDTSSNTIKDFIEVANNLYNQLIEGGVAKESARMILPECAKTKMYMTNNLRNWIHFIEVREDIHAQKEIRGIAALIKSQIKEQFPNVSKALNW